jgi:hypothetical protein
MIYKQRAKLFRFSQGQWKQRALGDASFLVRRFNLKGQCDKQRALGDASFLVRRFNLKGQCEKQRPLGDASFLVRRFDLKGQCEKQRALGDASFLVRRLQVRIRFRALVIQTVDVQISYLYYVLQNRIGRRFRKISDYGIRAALSMHYTK